MSDIFCPVHKEVSAELHLIREKQNARHCQAHEAQIHGLENDVDRIEEVNKDQWTKIDRLSVLIYSAAPITAALAFLGSLLGTYLRGK